MIEILEIKGDITSYRVPPPNKKSVSDEKKGEFLQKSLIFYDVKAHNNNIATIVYIG